jgi:hypothetical protein
MNNSLKLLDLFKRPYTDRFLDDEINLIKNHYPKSRFKGLYCLYRKDSRKGVYIAFMIDQSPEAWRSSAIFNHWEIVAERPLSKDEYEEIIQNFGCNNKRFIVYQYRDIEYLIKEDNLYGIATPNHFVSECKKRGYSRAYQTTIEFTF